MQPTEAAASPRTPAHRLARAVTEVFAPAVLAAVTPLVVAVATAGTPLAGLAWGALVVLFCAAVPYSVIWVGVRRGTLTDHHVGRREQRRRPLGYALLSVLAGLGLLVALGAPRPVVAMVAAMLAVLLAVGVVNLGWKLSAHAAVAAGSVAVLALVLGPALLAGAAVVALVGWSRVELRDHTVAQVLAGAAAGAVTAAPVFAALS
jgi:hypothetical protein